MGGTDLINFEDIMAAIQFGTIEKVDPRTIWAMEATDFTPWLAEHLALLGAVLGLDLELVKTEASVGSFSCDIHARETGSGRCVIIENQLGQTDHTHLGQLITYAAGLDAAIIVWIAPKVRDEHRESINFLNRNTRDTLDFFMIELEVVRIASSLPAVVFKLAAAPNTWAKTIATSSDKSISDKNAAYRKFYQGLLDDLREKHKFTNAKVAQPQSWYAFSSGVPGISYSTAFAAGNRLKTEIYIDVRNATKNKMIFDKLRENSEYLQAAVGEPLVWDRLDDRQASRISVVRENTSIGDAAVNDYEIREWLIQRLLKFKMVFGPHLEEALGVASTPDAGQDAQ